MIPILLQSIAILLLLVGHIINSIQLNDLEKRLMSEEQKLQSLSRQLAHVLFLMASADEHDDVL